MPDTMRSQQPMPRDAVRTGWYAVTGVPRRHNPRSSGEEGRPCPIAIGASVIAAQRITSSASMSRVGGMVRPRTSYHLSIRICGFDHGVGHSLLVLCDAKAPHGKKWNDFKALENYLFIVSISLS